MKALTLHQPWASLVALGVKTVETRSWSTSYRGPLAIHAAARVPQTMTLGEWHCSPRYKSERYAPVERRIWRSTTRPGDLFGSHEMHLLPLGAVVATCTLTDVVPIIDRWPSANPKSRDFRGENACVYAGDNYALALWRDGRPIFPSEEIEDQRPYGDFTPGRYAWILDNIEPLADPVSARGRQGLWNWEPA